MTNRTQNQVSRRQVLGTAAALATASGVSAAPAERYKLGVMSFMYPNITVDDAMTRIRKAGFKYVCPAAKHGGQNVFTPDMTKAERTAMLRRIRDLGLQPFMSLGGFGSEPHTEGGLQKYIAQLDLCADFEIPVMVGGGPWYFTKFPTMPKREREWAPEVSRFYAAMEKAVKHAESVGVTIALKPHTGITARAKDCIEVAKRIQSPRFKIAWDAGNVSFYEGIYPDPDLPDLAPHVTAVCIKDHKGGRAEANFPPPGQGQIDHEAMFRTLFAAGFNGPMSIEKVEGAVRGRPAPDVIDQGIIAAREYLVPLLDRLAPGA